MFSDLFEKIKLWLKGWKTIIWAWLLMTIGAVLGIIIPVLDALNVTQINAIIPPHLVPYAPLVLIAVGQVTKMLREATTGPVGAKGDEAPAANVKAGD